MKTVLFVCLHGGAKSVIAAEYFTRLAQERGLSVGAESAGIEPYADMPAPVIDGLARDGFNVKHYVPRQLQPDWLANASRVVSFACELPNTSRGVPVESWDDIPMVSDGFEEARDAIVARVSRLIDELARTLMAVPYETALED
jgi:arsenate reductase